MPKSAWFASLLFPHFPFGYLFQPLPWNRSYNLKEHEAVWFFQAESSWFVFRFRVNIFAGKISNLLLILRCEATMNHVLVG